MNTDDSKLTSSITNKSYKINNALNCNDVVYMWSLVVANSNTLVKLPLRLITEHLNIL